MLSFSLTGVLLVGLFATSTPSSSSGWSPEQWAFIIPILGLQLIGIVTAWRQGDKSNRSAEKVSEQVEAVHHEVRPPSNGTTAGAYFEASSQRDVYLYDALTMVAERIGMDMPAGWPKVIEVDPPPRPPDRRHRH